VIALLDKKSEKSGMKARNVALALLFFALIGVGICWVMRPAEVAPKIDAQAAVTVKVAAPPAAVVEMPRLPPVAPSSSASAADDDTAQHEPNPFSHRTSSAPMADGETVQRTKPPSGLTDAGTIEFTEGVPVTLFCNDGTKCTLTAHNIESVDQGGSVDQMEIDSEFEGPNGEKIATPKITVLNGKSVRINVDKTSLQFTAHMSH
jgi:hypothetical protein